MVDPQTRTVSLLAQTDNPDDLLKLGMFVRIMLDSSNTEQVLAVPASAVVEIETEKYVFVPSGKDADHEKFVLRPVEVGRQSGRSCRNQIRLDRRRNGRRLRSIPAQERADSSK